MQAAHPVILFQGGDGATGEDPADTSGTVTLRDCDVVLLLLFNVTYCGDVLIHSYCSAL
jgi:hypothetical protein